MSNMYLDMYMSGEKIKTIITALRDNTGCHVFILDRLLAVTHNTYSEEEIPRLLSTLPHVVKGLGNISHTYNGDKRFVAHPLFFSGDLLGWLCLECDHKNEIDVSDCIQVISIMVANDKKIYELESSLKGELVDSLLNMKENNIYEFQKKFLAYFKDSYCVLLVNIDTENPEIIKTYYQLMRDCLKDLSPQSLLLSKGSNIIVVFDSITDTPSNLIEKFQESTSFIHVKGSQTAPYNIGVSHVHTGMKSFKIAYEESQNAILLSENKISYFKDLELKHIILNTPIDERHRFLTRTLGKLMNYKKPQNEEFMDTLKTYLKSNRNWTETKEKLNIHGNTLTYRLQRISDILNIDLKDYYDVLKLQIAFEILIVDDTK